MSTSSTASPTRPDPLKERRILVVDHDPTVSEVVCSYLRSAGFLVDETAEGLSAVEIARRTRPDLIVHDRMLPGIDGIDGIDDLDGIDGIDELSRIHSGSLRLALQSVSLYDLISDVVAELGPFAQPRSISLVGDGARELTIRADPRELSRVVGNLAMNSIQHSPAGSPITVSARETEDGNAMISVIDAAGGIPEKDLGRVFEAGWRASNSRTPQTATSRSGGADLGLAIVQGIVHAHSGRVVVQNVPGGCRFDVFLPKIPVTA